ncbi:unnamed protein product [Cyprideis torosa]|uniref:Uncharacterized protein n=1 Tax=Cyprideis torosa TaxID=163714 RepID=A0A7R8ZGH7_9CRUS|nr:unnamed protein product [Cyprideis torosa]CAG0880056.1 unnamed protein product [Cyprideis torosa]
MKIWTTDVTFDSPWETVAQAVWRKYPNKFNPCVVATDVVDRYVEKGILHSERVVTSKFPVPGWVEAIIGTHSAAFSHEISQVDPKKRSFSMQVKNLSLGACLELRERLTYDADQNDSNKTHFHMEQYVTVFGVPLSSYLEDSLVETVRNNSVKGKLAIENVIQLIETEVDHWKREVETLTKETERCLETLSLSVRDTVDSWAVVAAEELRTENTPPPGSEPS